jgi:hypothetical protein
MPSYTGRLGVDSGYLDDAMLAPICLLSSRRIGILPFIRGIDLDHKHGVDIIRVNGIVYDKEKGMYKRVAYLSRKNSMTRPRDCRWATNQTMFTAPMARSLRCAASSVRSWLISSYRKR